MVIPPDLQDEIALLDGDTVEVELVKYRYRPPEIHLRLSIDEKDSLEAARKMHDKSKKNDKDLW